MTQRHSDREAVILVDTNGAEITTANPLAVAPATGNNVIGQVKITNGTVVADVLDLAAANPLAAAILDASGNQITSFGGGTQYTEADTDASITGTALMLEDTSDTLRAAKGDATSGLWVNVKAIVATALAAGTAAIGKLLPPDIDVTTHTNYAKKYYTSAGLVTDGIIWSPAAGKRWHVTDIFIGVSAAATVTLEDDKAAGDEAIWKMELSANSGWSHHFDPMYPWASGEDAANLIITTSAGNVYVTVVGYEI